MGTGGTLEPSGLGSDLYHAVVYEQGLAEGGEHMIVLFPLDTDHYYAVLDAAHAIPTTARDITEADKDLGTDEFTRITEWEQVHTAYGPGWRALVTSRAQ
ncbi:hypothetical protein Srot_1036 [Segniliparus rotundus DSM 44985]|uniref:Uncharacterized protein n=1 Tax=Segniliparus rotundus (strain ATCC BAA-972 / CDC 1076 / CIP 108378 / DSM 44985 / JCM 13578) TaxID=640132 RepID=D6ZEY5_SEGRD|nr:hypothetical protein [Segniliparus rotundus]ADG97509.1 hypothetical protein Srot_1036 [Segniliparus rotundus DSM 44985]